MDPVRRTAFETVARACGFAALAIVCILVGLSWNPPLAAKTGGFLSMLTTLTLLAKGATAPHRDHRDTEAWLLLDRNDRPPAAVAQRLTATALQEAYYTFAHRAAAFTMVLFALAVVLGAVMPPEMTQLR